MFSILGLISEVCRFMVYVLVLMQGKESTIYRLSLNFKDRGLRSEFMFRAQGTSIGYRP